MPYHTGVGAQHAPDDSYRLDLNEGLVQCEHCNEYFTEDYMTDVRLCNGKLTKTVCLECFERKYEFYDCYDDKL